MKKIIYFLMLILLIIFSWFHRAPGDKSTSGREESRQILKIK